MTNRSFKSKLVGDKVFVVHQNDRYRSSKGLTPKTETLSICKIGRKYLYLEGWQNQKFFKDNGVSAHHEDSNARSNGVGFDVYHSEDDYKQEQHEKLELSRLERRMISSRWNRSLTRLSPDTVNEIHKILDTEGVDRNIED